MVAQADHARRQRALLISADELRVHLFTLPNYDFTSDEAYNLALGDVTSNAVIAF